MLFVAFHFGICYIFKRLFRIVCVLFIVCIWAGLRQTSNHTGKPVWVWDADSVQRSVAQSDVPTTECLSEIHAMVAAYRKSAEQQQQSGGDVTGLGKKLLKLCITY